MECSYRSSFSLQYLSSLVGVLKVLHIIFGSISLVLVAFTFRPVFQLELFLASITVCLTVSTFYLIVHLIWTQHLLASKANRVASFVFHIIGGMCLIITGIDLIGWSEYGTECSEGCPHFYAIGVAKILTFVNGTLYGIVGFLGAREDTLDDLDGEEFQPLRPEMRHYSTSDRRRTHNRVLFVS